MSGWEKDEGAGKNKSGGADDLTKINIKIHKNLLYKKMIAYFGNGVKKGGYMKFQEKEH